MNKAEDIATLLRKMADRLDKLVGEDIGGVAFINPPEGDAVEVVLLGSSPNSIDFYRLMSEKIKRAHENNISAVGVPGNYGGFR